MKNPDMILVWFFAILWILGLLGTLVGLWSAAKKEKDALLTKQEYFLFVGTYLFLVILAALIFTFLHSEPSLAVFGGLCLGVSYRIFPVYLLVIMLLRRRKRKKSDPDPKE